MWIFISVFWSLWITCFLYIKVFTKRTSCFSLNNLKCLSKACLFQNLEMTYMWHWINEYLIYIKFFWVILDLFIFKISKVMTFSIAHVTRYVKQILAITWWSMWACLWRRIEFNWSMRFLLLWISLLVNFISIMQVFILRSFQRQDVFFSQIYFQSSDKIN